MLISLDYRDARPIYQQVKEGFRQLILSGGLAEGDKLPSVRELSASLAVNPNTIQRAYRELELEGWVYTVPARGSFAASPAELRPARVRELLTALDGLVRELRSLGVTTAEIQKRMEESGHA